jgi:hypothetical protein
MTLNVDEPLHPGASFRVKVWADDQSASKGESGEDVAIRVPKAQREFVLSVRLLVSAHFELPASKPKRVTLRRDKSSTSHAVFAVRVRDERLPNCQAEITALFQHDGRPAGKVVRQPKILGISPTPPSSYSLAFAPDVIVTPDRDPPPAMTEFQTAKAGSARPDVTISVLDTGERDLRHYRLIVETASGQRWEFPWVLPKRSDEIVQSAMELFVKADMSATGRISALKGAGVSMFEVTPIDFQQRFWRLVEKHKPQTILIISEEPYIPWELMVPTRWSEDDRRIDRPPLGVEFSIGRWVNRQYLQPPQRLPFSFTFVVAPRYAIGPQLKYAEREAKLVATSFRPSERIRPANLESVEQSVSKRDVRLLHFVGHGDATSQQTLYMDNKKDNLSCAQFKGLRGFVDRFPRARTFVFLNACEVGRPAPSLVGVGGLANEFLAIGAGAVIAPLWSVEDDVAFEVAKYFYETLQKSPRMPFAKILQTVRKKAYDGDAKDTWAAYSFYGSPNAALRG